MLQCLRGHLQGVVRGVHIINSGNVWTIKIKFIPLRRLIQAGLYVYYLIKTSMKKCLLIAVSAIVAVSAGVLAYNGSKTDDLFSANVEALADNEGHDYNNAKDVYCVVPAGQIGCTSALLRSCSSGVFCTY